MLLGLTRKKPATEHRSHRKHTKSRITDEQHGRSDAKHKDVLRTNKPSDKEFAVREKAVSRPEVEEFESEVDEEELPKPRTRRRRRSSPGPRTAPFYAPTEEEIKRSERYYHIRARIAMMPPAPGNIYNGVRAHGNASILAGNLTDSNIPEQEITARQHQYNDLDADGNSIIWLSNMTDKVHAVAIDEHRRGLIKGKTFHYGQNGRGENKSGEHDFDTNSRGGSRHGGSKHSGSRHGGSTGGERRGETKYGGGAGSR